MAIKDDSVRKLFWDTDPDLLDPKKHKDYIIRRIFSLGDQDTWQWAISTYSVDQIRSAIINARHLSPKDLAYFSTIFEVSKKDFRCEQQALLQTL